MKHKVALLQENVPWGGIYNLRTIIESYTKWEEHNLYFIDYERAFDRVKQEQLLNVWKS